jgi:multiple sugar transport system substrate-binding protein
MKRLTKSVFAPAVIVGSVIAITGCSTSAGGADDGTTITFQNQFSDAEYAEIQKLVAYYEDQNPNVTIELVRDNDSSYYDKLTTQIAAGKGPDIVRLEPPKVAQYITNGWLAPLDDVITDANAGDFFQNTLDAASIDGIPYAVPQDVSTLALFYRTDMLEAAGIETPPTTWDEFVADAEALTQGGNYGTGLWGGWGAYEFYPWLWQSGAEVLNEDGTEAVFNTPDAVSALQLWTDLQATAMPAGMATATEDDVRGAFVNGNLAMFTSGPYMTSILEEAGIGDVWAVAPLPEGKIAASVLGGMDLAVLNNSKNQEAAKDFLIWLIQDDVQTTWATDLGFVPVKKSLYDAPEFADDPVIAAFGEIIAASKSRPTIPAAGDVDAALGEAVQAALSGAATPQEALDAAVEKANAAING